MKSLEIAILAIFGSFLFPLSSNCQQAENGVSDSTFADFFSSYGVLELDSQYSLLANSDERLQLLTLSRLSYDEIEAYNLKLDSTYLISTDDVYIVSLEEILDYCYSDLDYLASSESAECDGRDVIETLALPNSTESIEDTIVNSSSAYITSVSEPASLSKIIKSGYFECPLNIPNLRIPLRYNSSNEEVSNISIIDGEFEFSLAGKAALGFVNHTIDASGVSADIKIHGWFILDMNIPEEYKFTGKQHIYTQKLSPECKLFELKLTPSFDLSSSFVINVDVPRECNFKARIEFLYQGRYENFATAGMEVPIISSESADPFVQCEILECDVNSPFIVDVALEQSASISLLNAEIVLALSPYIQTSIKETWDNREWMIGQGGISYKPQIRIGNWALLSDDPVELCKNRLLFNEEASLGLFIAR